MRISILGTDYKNAIFAGCLSFRGHTVIGVEATPVARDLLNKEGWDQLEPGLRLLLDQGRRSGRLSCTADLASAVQDTELTFVDENSSTEAMAQLWQQVGAALRDKTTKHQLVVRTNRSPQAALTMLIPLLEASSGKRCGIDFEVEVRSDFSGASWVAAAV